jgi:tetrahydromethanopterin S-methyltransferase subunit A
MPEATERLVTLLADLRSATAAKKCHRCGCFRGTVEQMRKALPALPEEAKIELLPLIAEGESKLVSSEYDCLGCAVCWPANVLNLASEAPLSRQLPSA